MVFYCNCPADVDTREQKPSSTELWLAEPPQPAAGLYTEPFSSHLAALVHSIVVNVFVSSRWWEPRATSPRSSVKGSLTTRKAISGHWAVCCTNSPASRGLSKPR